MLLGELGQLKNSKTLLGIEPAPSGSTNYTAGCQTFHT
jgi:hypothetical protein